MAFSPVEVAFRSCVSARKWRLVKSGARCRNPSQTGVWTTSPAIKEIVSFVSGEVFSRPQFAVLLLNFRPNFAEFHFEVDFSRASADFASPYFTFALGSLKGEKANFG